MDAETLVKIANSEVDYTQLPMLHNSAVHRDLVNQVRQRRGRVFFAASPHIIPGFSLAYLAQQYHSIVYDVVLLYEKPIGHLSQPCKFEKLKISQMSIQNNILRRFLNRLKRIVLKK